MLTPGQRIALDTRANVLLPISCCKEGFENDRDATVFCESLAPSECLRLPFADNSLSILADYLMSIESSGYVS